MKDIKKLINKKGWTGKELGQIELTNLCHNFKRQLEGKPYKPLVSRAEFRKMLATLQDPIQGKAYNEYVSVHEWLTMTYNIASAQEQQAQGNFKTLLHRISVAQALESTYRYVDELPIIMTEKQYNDYVSEREAELIADHDFNLFNLFEIALYCLMGELKAHPEADNPLKELQPQLEQELVTDPIILSRYNEVAGWGYYTIDETGERSDQMTPQEWKERITPPELREEIKLENATGELASRVYKRIDEKARATYNGATEEELEAIDNKYRLVPACTFHYYDNPPEDLDKWEILESGELYNYYTSLESLDHNGEELTADNYETAVTEDIEAFKKEFPTVFKAVIADMEKYIGKGAKTPVKKWANTLYSWEDLRDKKYYNFYETFVKDMVFDGNKRAIFNGVAILKEGAYNKHTIDKQGYYKTPDILAGLFDLSLNSFFTGAKDYADNVEEMEKAREVTLDSYYYMLGFNRIMELIADYYEVPQLEVFKFNTDVFKDRMDAFNGLVASLYKEIKDRDYIDKEEQEKKLEVLKDVFYPLVCDYNTPQTNIDKALDLFKSKEAFIGNDLTRLLCTRERGR